MDFELNEEQIMLRDAVRRMLERLATPEVLRQLDREQVYPYELYDAWIKQGLLQMPFPEAVGGLGGNVMDMVIIAQELAGKSFDLFTAYSSSIFCGLNLLRNGTPAQQSEWLPPLLDGSIRMSISMSEPDAGSDLSGMRTTARRDGDDWIINGRKLWATGAGARDNYINVYARTDPNVDYRRGMSLFLVKNDTPGLELRKLEMLGRRSVGTYELHFDNVRVPGDRLIGDVNKGWDCLLSGLQFERVTTSAGYCGAAQAVVDMALAHAKDRTQFDKPLVEHQAIAHMLADMQTEVEASRLLMWHAAWRQSKGYDALGAISMSKLFGSETYVKVANQGMQIMGAMGYSMECDMQRHYRDARSTTIGAGTSQMQRNLIARLMATDKM